MLPEGVFDECKAKAELAAERPRSTAGTFIVVALWLLAVLLAMRLLAFEFS
jgi:hypothetical protein